MWCAASVVVWWELCVVAFVRALSSLGPGTDRLNRSVGATAMFFHDDTNLSALRASSYDRPFRDARNADLFAAWQGLLRQHFHPREFDSCAVVGSSGSLLIGEPRGALIDQHDAVFRVNYAPTRGYEEYVGHKTTVWVLAWGANTSVNERHLHSHLHHHHAQSMASPSAAAPAAVGDIVHTSESVDQVGSSTLPLITLLHCQPSRELGDCWRRIGSGEPFHFGNATRFSPLAWLQLRSSIRAASGRVTIGSIPSTGALAVHAAMRLCAGKPISIFGFGNGSSLNCAMTGTPNGTLCDRYYALGTGAGLRRCVNEAATPCPQADYERCTRWRSSRGGVDAYTASAGAYHDFLAEWAWFESLAREVWPSPYTMPNYASSMNVGEASVTPRRYNVQ